MLMLVAKSAILSPSPFPYPFIRSKTSAKPGLMNLRTCEQKANTDFATSIYVGLGPRLLSIETAIRALIEQASLSDPTLRDRINEAADAYLATIPPLSELKGEFIERARACTAPIVRPPGA